MKIVVNSSSAIAGGAITHLRHLLPELAAQAGSDELLVVGTEQARAQITPPPTVDWIDVPPSRGGLLGRLTFENLKLPALLDARGADVLFHPGNFAAFRVRCPQVILVHNLAPFMPEVIEGESRAQKVRLRILNHLTRSSLSSAKATLFISEWGRGLVLGPGPADETRYPVIPFGAEHGAAPQSDEVLSRWNLCRDQYVLTVSHLYRYKKLENLLEAWAALGEEVRDWPLVVAGAPHDAEYAAQMRDLAGQARAPVHFTGTLDAPTLATLMAACRAFVFTSEAENLPITLLEAMAAGCPILTNRTCSMPETCGDAAIYADPPNADEYRAGLTRLLRDDNFRATMKRRATERARNFRWAQAAERTLEVLRAAGSSNRS